MTSPGSLPVCGARGYLPFDLVPVAVRLEKSTERPATAADVERHLRCTLQSHDDDTHHYGLVLELDGVDTGSVWTTWAAGGKPELLLVLPDCNGADGQPCSEFARHPGGHSHEVHDPWADMSHTLSH